MSSNEDRIREVRTAVAQANTAKTRAQAQRDAAQAKLDEATSTLHDEFGVKTSAEAKTLITKLQGELDAEIEKAQQALLEAGA